MALPSENHVTQLAHDAWQCSCHGHAKQWTVRPRAAVQVAPRPSPKFGTNTQCNSGGVLPQNLPQDAEQGTYTLPRSSDHVPGHRCSRTCLWVCFETLHALYMPSQSSLAQHHVAAPQAMVIFPVEVCPGKEHVFTSLRSKTAPWAQPASLRLGASPLWTPPSSRLSSSAWLRLAPHHAAPRQATRALQHSVQQAAFVSQHSALQHCSRPPIGRRRLRRCQRATVLTSSAVVQPLTVVHHSRHADHCRAS